MAEASVPDRDSPEYEAYLSKLIEDEEVRLNSLKEKCRITSMEEQLARLRLQSTELEGRAGGIDGQHGDTPAGGERGARAETGVAGQLLTASRRAATVGPSPSGSGSMASELPLFTQRSKDERETLSKLKALTHLSEAKAVEKVTYREFICAMTRVLRIVIDSGLDPSRYAAHLNFISTKAALNLYATDAIIKYEAAVTDRVISGLYEDWVAADPECVALHLGADATYSVRQGGSRWSRSSSGNSGGNRDFSDWPKEVCWLFNNTSCYFPRCKKAHICFKCKRTGHTMRECKILDDSASPSVPEVLSAKTAKETRKA